MVAEAEHALSATPYMLAALPLTRSIPNIGLIRSRALISLAEVRASAPPARAVSGTNHNIKPAGQAVE